MLHHINPLEIFGEDLQSVQNPCRYVGGEFGQIVKKEADFTFIMAFPDVYEIAMSNQAIKIIYNGLNAYQGIRCERVFAPEADFESLLTEKNVPLYSLESGIPLHQADMIGFSLGYELGITGVLNILDKGKIPLIKTERTENDPIVIAGGCGSTNPAPFSQFFDAMFIGEAEYEMFDLIDKLKEAKKNGAKRKELLELFSSHSAVWVPGKKAKRALQADFGQRPSIQAFYPLPSIKPVQDHGVVEIMRGCPNGCRFCHAGVYYRPQRMKKPEIIMEEVNNLVTKAGYREVSLTSLSSGDYDQIGELLTNLNKTYGPKHVSFQLPSLKVNSFTLPILESMSQVRKSGLTFAVETPVEAWQFSLNKEVYEEKLYDIIMSAKKRGWNKAKFYFMVGLPIERDGKKEEQEIVDFLIKIQAATKIQCNVNVGTFIPKAHTPYQWAKQLTMAESREKMEYIRSQLPRGKFKVNTHDEFVSFIEGMVSRGDERVGDLILSAYKKGCRLDAWEDHIKKDIWQEVISNAGWDVENYIVRERDLEEDLPWDEISLGPSKVFYKREWQRSLDQKLTPRCALTCEEPCGVCGTKAKVHKNITENKENESKETPVESLEQYVKPEPECNIPILYRVIMQFSKINGAEYLPHLALQEQFHKAFLRSGLDIIFTAGFNPLPRFELASSLSLGIHTKGEIGSCLLRNNMLSEDFISQMTAVLPKNIVITKAFIFPVTNQKKRESLATSLWGSLYEYTFIPENVDLQKVDQFFLENDFVTQMLNSETGAEITKIDTGKYKILLPFKFDRPLRNTIAEYFEMPTYKSVKITKIETLAHNTKELNKPVSYFDLYDKIASQNAKLIAEREEFIGKVKEL